MPSSAPLQLYITTIFVSVLGPGLLERSHKSIAGLVKHPGGKESDGGGDDGDDFCKNMCTLDVTGQ